MVPPTVGWFIRQQLRQLYPELVPPIIVELGHPINNFDDSTLNDELDLQPEEDYSSLPEPTPITN